MLIWPSAVGFPHEHHRRHPIERTLRLVTPPATLPIDLATAKKHLRVEDADSDDLITVYIQAAVGQLAFVNRAMVPATYALDMARFPLFTDHPFREIELPMPPLKAVTALKARGPDGTVTTIDPAVYTVATSGDPKETGGQGTVRLGYNQTWPEVRGDAGSVSIEFTAGYDTVPGAIRAAILLIINKLFDNRAEVGPGAMYTLPNGVDALVAPYIASPGIG